MLKTHYFQKVESLIELRKQLRVMTGVMESIEATILLWRRCDKIDEYRDYYWKFNSEEINSYLANLYADIDEVSILAEYLRKQTRAGFPRFNPDYFLNRRERLSNQMFANLRTVRQKLMQLRRTAASTASLTVESSKSQWERWIRRDLEFPALWVREVRVRLRILERQIEKSWRIISQVNDPEVMAQPAEIVD